MFHSKAALLVCRHQVASDNGAVTGSQRLSRPLSTARMLRWARRAFGRWSHRVWGRLTAVDDQI